MRYGGLPTPTRIGSSVFSERENIGEKYIRGEGVGKAAARPNIRDDRAMLILAAFSTLCYKRRKNEKYLTDICTENIFRHIWLRLWEDESDYTEKIKEFGRKILVGLFFSNVFSPTEESLFLDIAKIARVSIIERCCKRGKRVSLLIKYVTLSCHRATRNTLIYDCG